MLNLNFKLLHYLHEIIKPSLKWNSWRRIWCVKRSSNTMEFTTDVWNQVYQVKISWHTHALCSVGEVAVVRSWACAARRTDATASVRGRPQLASSKRFMSLFCFPPVTQARFLAQIACHCSKWSDIPGTSNSKAKTGPITHPVGGYVDPSVACNDLSFRDWIRRVLHNTFPCRYIVAESKLGCTKVYRKHVHRMLAV